MCIPLGDGVVVRMRLQGKANSYFCQENWLAFTFMAYRRGSGNGGVSNSSNINIMFSALGKP